MNMSSADSAPRLVVFHADDFGMNEAVNRGIIAGFNEGLLTSTSLLANAPAFVDALRMWHELEPLRSQGRLRSASVRSSLGDTLQPFDLGVHLNLSQGRPLTASSFPSQLLDADGLFLGVFRLLPRLISAGRKLQAPIRDELCAQIERAMEHGVAPTHLNGHQYVEMLPVVSAIIPELLVRYRIPVVRVAWERQLTRTTLLDRFKPAPWCLAQVKRLFAFDFLLRIRRCGVRFPDAFFGTAHAGQMDLPLLRRFIRSAQAGLTEIGIHPGELPSPEMARHVEEGWADPLASVRPKELACLTSRALANFLADEGVCLGRLRTPAVAISQRPAA